MESWKPIAIVLGAFILAGVAYSLSQGTIAQTQYNTKNFSTEDYNVSLCRTYEDTKSISLWFCQLYPLENQDGTVSIVMEEYPDAMVVDKAIVKKCIDTRGKAQCVALTKSAILSEVKERKKAWIPYFEIMKKESISSITAKDLTFTRNELNN